MSCGECGSDLVKPVDVDEPQDEGRFMEKWECQYCGATGTVSGREEQPPSEWNKYGGAFE